MGIGVMRLRHTIPLLAAAAVCENQGSGEPWQMCSRQKNEQGWVKMPNLSGSAFTSMFDAHLMDICENLKRLSGHESVISGIPANEQQHEQIVVKYNDFISSLRDKDRFDERPIKFRELISYIGMRFVFENTLMQLLQYPERENHKNQHASFIERINLFVKDIDNGRSNVDELVFYIGHWLLGHVLVSDKAFGDFEASLTDLPV